MSLTDKEYDALMDKFDTAETDTERGRIAAQIYCSEYDTDPAILKGMIVEERESGDAPDTQQSIDMDAGGIAWCDEQIAAREK